MGKKIKSMPVRQKDTYKVKWVKAAQQWCITTVKNGKQTQEWKEKL